MKRGPVAHAYVSLARLITESTRMFLEREGAMAPSQLDRSDVVASIMACVVPVAASVALEVLDVECDAEGIRVTLEDPTGKMDSEVLAAVTPLISAVIDEDPEVDLAYPGRYTLEVSTPGLERVLRTPAHFERFFGAKVNVKMKPGTTGERRFSGWILGVDGDQVRFAIDAFLDPEVTRSVAISDIERARTIFEWHGAEKKTNSGKDPAKK